jgi:PKD domain-containing protein
MPLRTLLVASALAVVFAVLAPSALASTCQLNAPSASDPGNALFDSGGFEFDTIEPGDPAPEVFATLADGGSNPPDGAPAGPIERTDSWDHWGALFVGGDGETNRYTSTDENSCALIDAGQELVFPVVTIAGLDVQRTFFVGSKGLPGVRLVELVHNPRANPITTSIQVGDTHSEDQLGDLGSDGDTVVASSSDGNTSLGTSDLWGVTAPQLDGDPSDVSLAHVWDGRGGADQIDSVTLTGTDIVPQDNLAYRWDNVTVGPGQTVAFLSYEIQQATEASDAALWNSFAADAARAREAAPLQEIYAGMSDQEIAAVRNWPKPQPTAAIAPLSKVDDATAVGLSAVGSAASSAAGICQGANFAWDFGDGATATGPAPSHRFKAGAHTVRLTVTNSCGTSATATQPISVSHLRPRARLTKRLKFGGLAHGRVFVTLNSKLAATATIVGTLPPGIARHASIARISRTVLKTGATLRPGRPARVRLRLRKHAVTALRRLHSPFILTLSIRVRDVDRNSTRLVTRASVRF